MRETIRNTIPSVADRIGLKIIDIESGKERHLPGSFHGFKAWLPDGKYIASADADNNLCLIPVEEGQPRTLVHGDSPSWWPQWSKDPKRLYFKQPWPGGKLCSIGIDDPDPIPTELMECPGRFAVCETGDWVAYEEPTGVSMVDLSSGSLIYHCPSPWPLVWVGFATVPRRQRVVLCKLVVAHQYRSYRSRYERQTALPSSGLSGGSTPVVARRFQAGYWCGS